METINVKFNIIEELSAVFFWVGLWGILDVLLHNTILIKYRLHCYIILILIAVYIKLG
jgi:hypothetical protein